MQKAVVIGVLTLTTAQFYYINDFLYYFTSIKIKIEKTLYLVTIKGPLILIESHHLVFQYI